LRVVIVVIALTWNDAEDRNVRIDHDYSRHDEVIAFQNRIKQRRDDRRAI